MRRVLLSCLFLGFLGISSVSLPVSTRAAGGSATSVYVRAGASSSYTDPSGNVWIGDADYSGGTEYATTHAISKTTTQPLYQAERYGDFTYTFSGLPAGSPYAVTLKFSEDYWPAAGERIFSVILNGATVLSNFDIFADSGGEYIADDKTFNATVNSSGQIVIQFQNGSVDNAKIDAIQLVPTAAPTPVISPGSETFTSSVPVSISDTNSAAAIYYTTDNSTPVPGMGTTQIYRTSFNVTAATTVRAIATLTGYANSAVASATYTLQAAATGLSTHVRAGTSTSYTDPSGNVWIGDADYSGGTEYATTHAITDTTTQPLYQTERYGDFTYTFSGLPAGSAYAVTLKFSEDYWTATGERIFSVILNGATVLSNFDIFADSGGEYIADDKTFNATVNSSGQIVIQFQNGSADNAKIDAIQLVPSSGPLPTSQISVIPSSVSFGSVVTGVTNTQTLAIRNPGAANLNVTAASISGTGFSSSGLTLPLTVAPGGSSSFNVAFTPTAASNFSGSLTLVNNSSTSSLVVPLSGTGISPALQLSASPASISFGSLTTGTTTSQTVTLSNVGNASVSLSQLTVSPSAFSSSRLALPMTLAPGQSASVTVTFAPTAAVSYQGSVSVASNITSSPTTISLSGSGAAATAHSSTLNWTPSASSYTGFNVYRGSQSGGPYTKMNSASVPAPSYTDTAVAAGQTYYYVVTELNPAGLESAYSNVAVATIP